MTKLPKILILLILTASCATKIKNASLATSRSNICLDGGGKGILSINGAKHGFNFESGVKYGKWLLALNFVIGPEQVFEIDLSSKENKIPRILLELESLSSEQKDLFVNYVESLTELLKDFYKRENKQDWKLVWSTDGEKVVAKNKTLTVEFDELRKHYNLVHLTNNKTNKKLIEMKLYVRSCMK